MSLRLQALKDLLAGPEGLFDLLGTRIKEVRASSSDYTDSNLKPSVEDFPRLMQNKPPRNGRGFRQPHGLSVVPWAAKTVLSRAFGVMEPERNAHPQAQLPHMDNTWWRTSQYDSVLVSNAEGTGVSWYRRDPKTFRVQMAESARLIRQLTVEWPRLRKRYQAAFKDLVALESWSEVFVEHTDSELTR